MNVADVEPLLRAVLYEGYLLYPYRRSALKNRQRWLFGRLLPEAYVRQHRSGDRSEMRMECLVAGTRAISLGISVRFLQLRACHQPPSNDAASETLEREVVAECSLDQIVDRPLQQEFLFEPQLVGVLTAFAAECEPDLFKVTVTVANQTPVPGDQTLDQALAHSMLMALTVVHVSQGGELISLIDPPPRLSSWAASCQNVGVWPVLLGPQAGAMMLAAPIILQDYPQIAPESPGDSFDGTEIDELLALRIQTLTEAEKLDMILSGEQAQAVLRRTESLTEDELLQLHGRVQLTQTSPPPFQPGDRVRLRPRKGADALDLLLRGEQATVVAVEHDFENRVYLAVVVDRDPGRELGVAGHPGHRFFYGPDEVDAL